MRSEEEVIRAIRQYSDTVKRICLVHLKNSTDTEDVFQDVFLKYALCSAAFESPEHEKAWLIRVTMNSCKDFLKRFFRNRTMSLERAMEQAVAPEDEQREVLQAVLRLPEKYRRVVYLHYYEGYTAPQIGKLLNKNVNTVYTLITRARQLLRNDLGGEYDEA